MNDETALSRRRLLRGVVAGAGVGLLSGCDALSQRKGFIEYSVPPSR